MARPSNSARTDVPDAAEPRVRFPDFDERPVRTVTLGDVTEDCTERNAGAIAGAPIMGVSKADGIVPMEQRLIGKDTTRYKRLGPDWFAYNPMRLNIGSIARWKGEGDVLVSPDYVVFRCRDEGANTIRPDYLDHFRSSRQWESFVTESGDGGVRVRIYYKDLATLRLGLPEHAEQRKIADCLTALDECVAVQCRKLEALKAHKKGLMQTLFPQSGERVPRLRFPEFRDGPEWQESRLGDLGRLVTGLTYSPSDVQAGGLLVLRSSNIRDGEIKLDDRVYVRRDIDGANIAEPQDILICVRNGSKPLIGKNAMIPVGLPTCTHGAFMTVFRAEAAHFVHQLLQSAAYRRQVAADLGATINSINGGNLLRYRFIVPSPPEQQRIADCLASLDAAIAAVSAGLTALKTHKSGVMQGLFPSPEGE